MLLRTLSSVALGTQLASCALTDTFSDRVTEYNKQTGESRRTAVLTNIIRSAHTMPLQFAELSTITGQSSGEAGLSSSLPFRFNGTPTLTGSVTPSGRLTAGSTFILSNLSTQEFYQGIQTPVSKATIALYLRNGFPAQLLLPLVISELNVQYKGSNVRLLNDPSNPVAFGAFNDAIRVMIAKGFSVQDKASTTYGPTFTSEAAAATIQGQIIATTNSSAPTLEKNERGYQLKSSSSSAAFCFDPLIFEGGGRYSSAGVLIGSARSRTTPLRVPLVLAGTPLPEADILVDPSKFCGVGAHGGDRSATQKAALNLTVSTRSVAGIFAYLGAIVRTEQGLAGPQRSLEMRDREGNPYRIFRLGPVGVEGRYISAQLDSFEHFMLVDPTGRDGSSRVVQLLTDLMALNSTTKSFPPSNVLPILSQ